MNMLVYATKQVMCRPHLLTILYVNQSINKVWGQQNKKGNGGSPDPFLVCLRHALRKKGLAHKIRRVWWV